MRVQEYGVWRIASVSHALGPGAIIMARILIVDDDEAERVVLGTILRRAGHETFFAEDGEKAQERYRGGQIEIVLTDLQMPAMHGLELISLLRDRFPRPAIIAISGTGEPQLDIARAIGAEATLSKPVDPSELLRVVSRAIDERVA